MSATEEKVINIFGATLTRGKFVKESGALVAGFGLVGAGIGASSAAAAGDDGGTSQLDRHDSKTTRRRT